MDNTSTAYYSLTTQIGDAKISRALALKIPLPIVTFGIGDGNGASILPTKAMSGLAHQIYTGEISSLLTDSNNPAWLVAEVLVPAEVGGWTAREIALFDSDGDMIAVGNIPESYKPVLTQGSGREMRFRMIVEFGAAANVVLKIDPAIVIASKQWVFDEFNRRLLPPGGKKGYKLVKLSDVDYDVAWRPDFIDRVVNANTEAQPWDCCLVDVRAGAVEITLPAAPSPLTRVKFVNFAGDFSTHKLTVIRNGNTIRDVAEDMAVTRNNRTFELIWSGTTWRFA